MYYLIFICLLKVTSSDNAVNSNIINTNSGPIRGVPSKENDVEAYLGIPYAEPPVGELRFAKPISKTKWTEIYDASTAGPPCFQFKSQSLYFEPDTSNMTEDCLYLNIWAPRSKPTSGLRPIIIFIHPGAFVAGSSTTPLYDGSHLASRGDIVVASFNYRLGVFGYFLAYTEEANGNMGEFDKIMAIKWMKENAEYFNGDPENICLMGASAGAFSVSALLVSPLSQDLFRRAIMQGGSIFHPFFLDDNARLFKNSKVIASVTNCSKENVTLESNPQTVVNCLKNKSAEHLIKAQEILSLNNIFELYPRINDEYLPNSSIDLYREGKFSKDKDLLFGITEDEGTFMIFNALPQYVGIYGKDVKGVSKFRAAALGRAAILFSGISNTSGIIEHYMNNIRKDKSKTSQYFGDRINDKGKYSFLDICTNTEIMHNYKKYVRNENTEISTNHATRDQILSSLELSDFYANTLRNETKFDYLKMLSNIVGDLVTSCNTVFNADIASLNGNKVYFYKLDFRSENTPTADWVGSTHLDELQYIFGNPYHGKFTSEEKELSLTMMDSWASFAREGKPGTSSILPWCQYTYQKPFYRLFSKKSNLGFIPNKRCEIWRKQFKAVIDEDS